LYITGDSVVAGLVPATSRDISMKDYTESHADLVDAWGQCHTKGWGPAPGRPLHCRQGCSPKWAQQIKFVELYVTGDSVVQHR